MGWSIYLTPPLSTQGRVYSTSCRFLDVDLASTPVGVPSSSFGYSPSSGEARKSDIVIYIGQVSRIPHLYTSVKFPDKEGHYGSDCELVDSKSPHPHGSDTLQTLLWRIAGQASLSGGSFLSVSPVRFQMFQV